MPLHLIADLERVLAVPVIEAYGMTEASPQVASNRLSPEAVARFGRAGRPGPRSRSWMKRGNRLRPEECG